MKRFLTVLLSILLVCTVMLTARIINAKEDNTDIEEIAEIVREEIPEESVIYVEALKEDLNTSPTDEWLSAFNYGISGDTVTLNRV